MRGDLIVAGIFIVLIGIYVAPLFLLKFGFGAILLFPILGLLVFVGGIMILAGFFTSHSKFASPSKFRGGQGSGASTAIVIVFVLGLLFVSAFVDLVTCSQCGGSGVTMENTQTEVENLCSMCGGDGKVTVLDYIRYRVSEGVKNGG